MSDATLMTEGQNTQVAEATPAATTEASAPVVTEQQTATQPVKAETDSKPAGAPDSYEFSPGEGNEFDPSTIAAFSEVAKELNLTQGDAQKILDKMAPAMAAKNEAQIEAVRNEWAESSKADKEFGGDKLTESLASAKKAIDAFGTPELRTLLNETGLGNHPDVIRFMVRAGKAISEDGFISGSGAASSTKSAQGLYSKSNMNP